MLIEFLYITWPNLKSVKNSVQMFEITKKCFGQEDMPNIMEKETSPLTYHRTLCFIKK